MTSAPQPAPVNPQPAVISPVGPIVSKVLRLELKSSGCKDQIVYTFDIVVQSGISGVSGKWSGIMTSNDYSSFTTGQGRITDAAIANALSLFTENSTKTVIFNPESEVGVMNIVGKHTYIISCNSGAANYHELVARQHPPADLMNKDFLGWLNGQHTK